MSSRVPWQERTIEEAHLFNPAFIGALCFEYVKANSRASEIGHVEIPTVFCALPLALHRETRKSLPSRTTTSVYTWLQREPRVQVGYSRRAKDLAPAVREGIIYAQARNALTFDEAGNLSIGLQRASFTNSFLQNVTSEMREIVIATRFLGRWFATAGSTTTLLAAWRITV